MAKDWQELTRITRGSSLTVERVRITDNDIIVEGSFELPPLARLILEDQVFVTAFIRNHGSIKDMEELFGISYPTVKNRLNRIAQKLEFVEINPPPSHGEIIAQLERGEITVEETLKKLRGQS